MRLGPVMVDVAGLELTPDDIERLQHPQVGGVILFARNSAAPLQLIQLTHSIREIRKPALLIAVDHEGGRVQRFKHGFTAIPAMRELGRLWDRDPAQALAGVRELHIGHAIVSRAVFVGMREAVREMKALMHGARGP